MSGFREAAEKDKRRCLIKKRDIYNAKRTIKRRALRGLTPTQALLKMLIGAKVKNAKKWVFEARKNRLGQLTHLFFANRRTFKLLRKNHEALVIDCTYKTNKFKLPLCAILGHTPIKTTSIVAYAFILQEKEEDYAWVLMQIKLLYERLLIPNPVLLVTDADQALANGIIQIFPDANHLLCVFHIDNNVKTQATRALCFEMEIKEFMAMWKAVHQAPTVAKADERWEAIETKYRESDPDLLDYCWDTWMEKRAEQSCRCYTNEVLNFGITVTSSCESAHGGLKTRLQVSTGDLGYVIEHSDDFIRDQIEEYDFTIEDSKERIPFSHQIRLFRELNLKITRIARDEILKQYQMVKDFPPGQDIGICTGQFRRSMGLPCKHEIQRLLLQMALAYSRKAIAIAIGITSEILVRAYGLHPKDYTNISMVLLSSVLGLG